MPPCRRNTLGLPANASTAALHAYLVQPTQRRWLRIDGFNTANARITHLVKFIPEAYEVHRGPQPDLKIYAYDGRGVSLRVFSPDGTQPYEAWCMFPYLLLIQDVLEVLAWGPAGNAVLFKVPWSAEARRYDFLYSRMTDFYTLVGWFVSPDEGPVGEREIAARLHTLELLFLHAHRMKKHEECVRAVRRGAVIAHNMDAMDVRRLDALRRYTQHFNRLSVVFTPDLWAFRHWNVALRHVLPPGVRANVAKFLQHT